MGEMRELSECEGIKLHMSVLYHPPLNGVAERAIRVLNSAVRAMLRNQGLPDSLWAGAFSTAAYVHNRTPTRMLKGLTPSEARHEIEPDLCAFGAPCSIIEPLENLKELDDRANVCFFRYSGGGDRNGNVVVGSRFGFFLRTTCCHPLSQTPKLDN